MDYPNSVPGVGLVDGKFVDEDPGTGRQGSLIPASWGNAVTAEILAVIQASGLEPDEASAVQLLAALNFRSSNGAVTFGAVGVTQWQVPDVLRLGLKKARVLVVGAGGSGYRIASTDGGTTTGGAGGGWVDALLDLTGVQSVAVTIGAGGAAPTATGPGLSGGASSFGALLSATGGSGGTRDFGANGLGNGGIGTSTVAGALIGRGTSGFPTPIGGSPGASIFGSRGEGGWAGTSAGVPGAGSGSGMTTPKGSDGFVSIHW